MADTAEEGAASLLETLDQIMPKRNSEKSTAYIRTPLQATIVRHLQMEGQLPLPIAIVVVLSSPSDPAKLAILQQVEQIPPEDYSLRIIHRNGFGRAKLFFSILWNLRLGTIRRKHLHIANLNWIALALALKITPSARIHSFDDGSANVLSHEHSYRSTTPSRKRGVTGWIIRKVFPKGCAAFSRERICHHVTIYPGLANVAPDAITRAVEIDWAGLIPREHLHLLPTGVGKIFLGSVFEELARFNGTRVTQPDIDWLKNWADLYIPHPRHPDKSHLQLPLAGILAESIIDHYSRLNVVHVAHYSSSALLPFRSNPNVIAHNVHDLMTMMDLKRLGKSGSSA